MVLAFGAIATPAEEGLLLRPWREVINNNDPHPIPELMRAIAHMIAEVRTIELPSTVFLSKSGSSRAAFFPAISLLRRGFALCRPRRVIRG
jgi:hypothetical protein